MVLDGVLAPLVFIGLEIIMFMVVPWERVKDLAWVGLAGGLAVGLLLIYIMQEIYVFWVFHRIDIVNIAGIPVFLSAAWIPVVIIFSYLLIRSSNLVRLGILFLFPLVVTLGYYLLTVNDMLMYSNWSNFQTYIVFLVMYILIAMYLYITGDLENVFGYNKKEGCM